MKLVTTVLVSAALIAAPVAADAHGFHRHHHGFGLIGGVFGLAGAVVVGAATIATLPIRVLADAASGPHYRDRAGYDGRGEYDRGYGDDGPRRGYDREGYYSGERYRGGAEYDYAPRPDHGTRDYARDDAPPNDYARTDDYAPRGYDRDYDRDRPAYGHPRYYERGDDTYADARDRSYGRDFDRDRAYGGDSE